MTPFRGAPVPPRNGRVVVGTFLHWDQPVQPGPLLLARIAPSGQVARQSRRGRATVGTFAHFVAPVAGGPVAYPGGPSALQVRSRRPAASRRGVAWIGGARITVGPGLWYNVYSNGGTGGPPDYSTPIATTTATAWSPSWPAHARHLAIRSQRRRPARRGAKSRLRRAGRHRRERPRRDARAAVRRRSPRLPPRLRIRPRRVALPARRAGPARRLQLVPRRSARPIIGAPGGRRGGELWPVRYVVRQPLRAAGRDRVRRSPSGPTPPPAARARPPAPSPLPPPSPGRPASICSLSSAVV